MQLEHHFIELIGLFSKDLAYNNQCWEEISKHYSGPQRHYHNLTHLETMISELELVKDKIGDWSTVLCSVFYHDIIYSATRKDNELKSAEFMKTRLQKTDFEQIDACFNQILATKKHLHSKDRDTNYLLDADLVILGKPWADYEQYTRDVRTEYKIYPDLLYKPGRRKVLKHFLELDQIYKTSEFRDQYEEQARLNLKRELELR